VTRPYAEVIGDPIAHSKSPLIHNFWLEKLGIDAEYRACHVRPDEIADYFARRREDANWRGCNVTIPHKERVSTFADEIDAKARAVGASNCLFRDDRERLVATNTDVDGVAEAIAGFDPVGAYVCVLGNGGAARAAFHALADRPIELLVLARDPQKAAKISAAAGCAGNGVLLEPGNSALVDARLFINATQLGMTGQEPMPSFVLAGLAEMDEGATVFDMVYAPLETELLATARGRGLRTVDGLVMLVGQAAAAFEKFFGQPAPREHDAELRSLLTAG
jgi:shikimate dehydrogenase